MKSGHSFTKAFLFILVMIAVVTIGLVGYFWISNEFGRFKEESAALRKEYIEAHRQLIKNETEKAIDYIEFKKSQAENRLKRDIKNRAEEAHAIAMSLYRRYHGKMTPADAEKMIIAALRPIRFSKNRGYFFATRLDGMEMLFADRPEMEGKNLLDMQDTKGRFVIRDMIDLIRKEGKGFYQYTWTKPNREGKGFPKIAYLISMEPLNWFIGTGGYLDDVVLDIQQEVLDRINKIRFGENGYIFAGQFDGLSLSGPAKGQYMLDLMDVNGVRIVQELILTAQSGGGYVNYVVPEFNGMKSYRKLSYTKAVKDWKWYVGTGIDVSTIDTVIAQRRAALRQRVKSHVFNIIWILVAILGLILLVAKLFFDKIRKSFDLMTDFFLKAATESSKIDQKQLHFTEFEQLAITANQMVSQRSKAEEALRESERQIRLLLDSTAEAIYGLDLEGNCTFANPACVRLLGYRHSDDLIGKNMHELIHHTRNDGSPYPVEACGIIQGYQDGRGTHSDDNILWRADGTGFSAEYWSHPVYRDDQIIGAVVTFLDITERKRMNKEREQLEAQLQQSRKMEAIGTLAGGIAHDFNNILSAIFGYSEIALFSIPDENKARDSIDQVLKAGYRARDLVKQILVFSRQGDFEQKPIQIQYVVKEALKLLRASLPATIEIQQNISTKPGSIMADLTKIHQVLMNLCTNALHAMQEDGGILEVGVQDVRLGVSESKKLGLTPGGYVVLSVKDTGCGMDRDTRERIFNPYFTTKEKDVGIGMGLAVVHGIVKEHGGAIAVDSEPGKGTLFHIYFPKIVDDAKHEEKTVSPMPGGNERILLVDDEKQIINIGRILLQKLGYQVTTKTCPLEVLDEFKTHPDAYDLVITDFTMPKMTGDRLAEELMAIRPDIPIILCTGFSQRITEDTAKAMGIRGFVMKPIVIRELAEIIRNVLDE